MTATILNYKSVFILIGSLLLTACDNESTHNKSNDAINYPVRTMSGFNIAYPTSFSLSRDDTEQYFQLLPDHVQDVTSQMLVYQAKPVCQLSEVRLVYFKLDDMMSYDIDTGAQGIVDNISTIDGMKETSTTIKPFTVSEMQARQIFFEGKLSNQKVSYEGVLIADTNTNRVWQLQFIAENNSNNNQKVIDCTNRYVNSISINQ
ncbi:TPA: hypothetical protein QHL53_003359 [Proteus mirabilis]|nr:hypothetical protein [Proteus mirabilis]